jgi:O-acetyl-ADP-ribose deacetylase (regulator of RNase III)
MPLSPELRIHKNTAVDLPQQSIPGTIFASNNAQARDIKSNWNQIIRMPTGEYVMGNIVKGDLIHLALIGRFDAIVHGCNCFCTMGAGIAKRIRETFPQAYQADLKTGMGDREKLGAYSLAHFKKNGNNLTVINGYTQYDFSGQGVLVDYAAVRKLFAALKTDFPGKRIGYPKIGAGLAKGDWEVISWIINEELEGEDHTLVEYIDT